MLECIHKQKSGKAVGFDGVAMEANMNGGPKLAIHLCILFNHFIELRYIPNSVMQSLIIPLVKNKNGDCKQLSCNSYIYTVGHRKHTKMCFTITFVKLDGF